MRYPHRNGQSVAVAALHPAIVAPLSGVATQRLSLQPLGREDLDELTAIFAQRGVWKFEYGRGLTRSESAAFLDRQINLWDEYGFGGCGVRESVQMDLIGVVGLAVPVALPELLPAVTIGWRFSPTSWGKGYATEAATALLDQAFTPMGLDRVGCVTNAENRRSVAVAERLGMNVITETMVPSDDGTSMVAALLFQVASNDWLAVRARRSRTQLPICADRRTCLSNVVGSHRELARGQERNA
jgi:RimJ/RimL family protein N-acetyltransferase